MSIDESNASRTHERPVLEEENGELAEDVTQMGSVERTDRQSTDVDEEGMQSFPASDAPSSWSGPSEDRRPGERADPDDSVPKTLRHDDDR